MDHFHPNFDESVPDPHRYSTVSGFYIRPTANAIRPRGAWIDPCTLVFCAGALNLPSLDCCLGGSSMDRLSAKHSRGAAGLRTRWFGKPKSAHATFTAQAHVVCSTILFPVGKRSRSGSPVSDGGVTPSSLVQSVGVVQFSCRWLCGRHDAVHAQFMGLVCCLNQLGLHIVCVQENQPPLIGTLPLAPTGVFQRFPINSPSVGVWLLVPSVHAGIVSRSPSLVALCSWQATPTSGSRVSNLDGRARPTHPCCQMSRRCCSPMGCYSMDLPTHRSGAALDVILTSNSLPCHVAADVGPNCCPIAPRCCPSKLLTNCFALATSVFPKPSRPRRLSPRPHCSQWWFLAWLPSLWIFSGPSPFPHMAPAILQHSSFLQGTIGSVPCALFPTVAPGSRPPSSAAPSALPQPPQTCATCSGAVPLATVPSHPTRHALSGGPTSPFHQRISEGLS